MIISDFNLPGVTLSPLETDAPLIIDTDGILSSALTFQQFKPIARRNAQVGQDRCSVQQSQLIQGPLLDARRQSFGPRFVPDSFRFRVGK
jgi:hypothetical protein